MQPYRFEHISRGELQFLNRAPNLRPDRYGVRTSNLFFCPNDAEFGHFLMIDNDIFQFLIIFIKVEFQIKNKQV